MEKYDKHDAGEQRVFIDALRAVMGIGPLYASDRQAPCFHLFETHGSGADDEWFVGGQAHGPTTPQERTRLSVASARRKRLNFTAST